MTLTRLELLRLLRTHRWMALFGVYVFFGVLGPFTAAYMEELIARFGGGMEIAMPEPTPADGIAQFLSNASQLGVLAVIVVASGALAIDAKPEVAAFLRTRVERPARLLIPRYGVVVAASALALVAGTTVAWALTAALIGGLPAGAMLLGTLLGALYLAFAVAVVAAVATAARSLVATILGAIVVVVSLPALGLLPALAPWMPSTLVNAVVELAAGAPVGDFARAAGVTAMATPVLLWIAAARSATAEL